MKIFLLSLTATIETTEDLKLYSKKERTAFLKYYPQIVDHVASNEKYSDIPGFNERLRKFMYYTIPTGKTFIRGLSTILAYKMLEREENITQENARLATILGWVHEMVANSTVIIDDIVDRSESRRNVPCWYKLEGVGNLAILDAAILENSGYLLLKDYFCSHLFYLPMSEVLINVALLTSVGQILDCTRPELEQITMERYDTIVKYKSFLGSFWTSVSLGMYLSKTYDEQLLQQSSPILFELTKYCQVLNDYGECFLDLATTGKDCTDIREGKCTWMAVKALQMVNSTQRKVMQEYFGKDNPSSTEAVVTLYKELNLPEEFEEYKRTSFEWLCARVDEIENLPLHNLLQVFVEEIYKYKKS